MANTTNLDLVKPLGTDHALVSVINSNMDKIDAYAGKTDDSIGSVQDGMAIVANGDTHAAISAGQFVYVKNHNTLAEGLYMASTAIAQDAALSTSNLTADTSGGLNALNSKITTYYDGITYTTLDAIKTMLSTLATSMSNQEIKNIVIHTGTNISLAPFTSWGYYSGFISKNDSAYWSAYFVGVDGNDVEIGCNNGTISVSSSNSEINALDSTSLKFIMQTKSQSGQYTVQLKLGSQYLIVADRYSVTESNYACMYYVDACQGDKHVTRLTSNTGILSNISISSDAVLSYTAAITYVRVIIIEISH